LSYLIASILLLLSLRLQHGRRMVITQGLTIDYYENVISDVWKTMYSSKKPVTSTHPLSFWYWRITNISWHFAAYLFWIMNAIFLNVVLIAIIYFLSNYAPLFWNIIKPRFVEVEQTDIFPEMTEYSNNLG
jgi:hypothetical protein